MQVLDKKHFMFIPHHIETLWYTISTNKNMMPQGSTCTDKFQKTFLTKIINGSYTDFPFLMSQLENNAIFKIG